MASETVLTAVITCAFLAPAFATGATANLVAITDARIYTSAAEPPLPSASILIGGGRIITVGERIQIPPDAKVIRCDGCSVMAGFWNSHIHFTEPKWDSATTQPAPKLAGQLQAMLLRSGFVTVVDTGSILANTLALRRRIDSGEIPGPRIYTAGVPVYPPDGIPYYVKESMPAEILGQLSSAAGSGGSERSRSRQHPKWRRHTEAVHRILDLPLEGPANARANCKGGSYGGTQESSVGVCPSVQPRWNPGCD